MTMPKIFVLLCLGISDIYYPSIVIFPCFVSYSLNIKPANVDFPDPDSPTIATFSFRFTFRVKSLNIEVPLFSYPKLTFSMLSSAPALDYGF